MIPKTIHYCWFGGNPKPSHVEKCIRSWKRFCPDFEIIEWNENSFNLAATPLYVRQAYEAKKWAFVTDYVRLQVVYDHGGIYLDTDVELIKRIDFLLDYHAFFGFEDGKHVATGLGFGAEKETPILQELMDDYNDLVFLNSDGTANTTSCPRLNTRVFLRHGLKQDDSYKVLEGDIHVLPTKILCPIDYGTGKKKLYKDTVSIHWFDASWHTLEENTYIREMKRYWRREERLNKIRIPVKRLIKRIIGEKKYLWLKSKYRRS